MTAKKLDFYMHINGEPYPIKVRLFKSWNGLQCVSLDGGICHGWEANRVQMNEVIPLLQSVSKAMAEEVHGIES